MRAERKTLSLFALRKTHMRQIRKTEKVRDKNRGCCVGGVELDIQAKKTILLLGCVGIHLLAFLLD